MTDPKPSILVTYNNEPVALINARQVSFLPPASDLPAGHPQLRLFIYMARYAQLIASDERPGPYTDADGESFARAALVDTDKLRAHGDETDEELAECFMLPVEQIQAARLEILPASQPDERRDGR